MPARAPSRTSRTCSWARVEYSGASNSVKGRPRAPATHSRAVLRRRAHCEDAPARINEHSPLAPGIQDCRHQANRNRIEQQQCFGDVWDRIRVCMRLVCRVGERCVCFGLDVPGQSLGELAGKFMEGQELQRIQCRRNDARDIRGEGKIFLRHHVGRGEDSSLPPTAAAACATAGREPLILAWRARANAVSRAMSRQTPNPR